MEKLSGFKVGSRSQLFWQPWLSRHYGLRPSDMAEIFCLDWVQMALDVREAAKEK